MTEIFLFFSSIPYSFSIKQVDMRSGFFFWGLDCVLLRVSGDWDWVWEVRIWR